MRKKYYFLLFISLLWVTHSFAQSEIDSVRQILEKRGDKKIKLQATNYLAELYWPINPKKTIVLANEALKMAREQRDEIQISHAYLNLCQGYLYQDDYANALDFGLKCLELRQQGDDLLALAYILRTIGWLYYDMENSDMSITYHKETLIIYEELGIPDRIGNSLNALGLVHTQKGSFQTALSYFERSLEMEESLKNDQMVSVVLSNMGGCYQKLGRNQLALDYLVRSLGLNQFFSDDDLMVVTLNRMGNAYLGLNRYEKASLMLDSAAYLMRTSQAMSERKVLRTQNLLSKSILYAAKQDFKKSHEAMGEYNLLRDSILSDEKSYALMEMRVGYEQERREADIKLLEHEKTISNLKRNVLIAGLLGLLVMAILIGGRLRSSYRKNRIILEAKQALTNAELETTKLSQERLKNELDYKNNELTTFATHIAQKNELFNGFIDSLTHIERSNFDEKHVNKIISSFKNRLEINQELEEFYTHTELVHQDFLFNLKEKFPDLTDHDKKLSSQIILNLSNKEIAALNNVSLKSVEVGRSRLRKKLGIDSQVNFTEFLQSL